MLFRPLARRVLPSLLVAALAIPAMPAIALPPGFYDETIVGSGLVLPVYLTALPDGRMLVVEKGGQILVFDTDTVPATPTPYMQLTNVATSGELGAASLVLHPEFESNGYFYLYYSHASSQRNRVSRFTHLGATADPASETLIWEDNEPFTSCCHFGGGMAFGADGNLYITTGEEFDGNQSQDLTRAGGKIIRVTDDGSIPPDNPFIDGPGGNLDEIWAYGLRNPFRVFFDVQTNRLYIADVGGNDQATAREEINVGVAGANYGWPLCEGVCSEIPGIEPPLYDYAHTRNTPAGGSVAMGFVYRGNQFPSEYAGRLFYGDYALDLIETLELDGNGDVLGVTPFAAPTNGLVHLTQGTDGSLYWVQIFGTIKRVRFADGNLPPTFASVTATPTAGASPLAVNFAASATDPELDPLSYRWIFGDGTEASGANVVHTYLANGVYTAFAQVEDGTRTTTSDPIPIVVGQPPIVTIVEPIDGATFRAGEVIDFSATAVDPDGTLTPSDYSWTVRFAHNDHHHPSLGPQAGQSGSFEIDSSGHDFTDETGYELVVTVTDADGLTTTATVVILPDKSNLSIETVPAGLELVVDTLPRTAPFVLDTLIGFRHELVAQPALCQDGTTYLFQGWSNGAAAVQTYVVPETDETLTATYAVGGPCVLPTTGIVLHLDASSGVQASGGAVTQWNDLSGRGNHLVAVGQPQHLPAGLNGRGVIRFDGVDDRLERIGGLSALPAGSADRTVIVVANYLGTGVGGFSYGTTACNQSFGAVVNKIGNLQLQGWCSPNDKSSTTPGTGAGWLTQTALVESNTYFHFKDGVLIGDGGHIFNTVLDRIVVGAELDNSPHVAMEIAEIIVYDRALTALELADVESHVQQRYYGPPQNQTPVANPDLRGFIPGAAVTLDVLSNDEDPDGSLDPSTVVVVAPPDHGTAVVNPATGAILYTHDGGPSTNDDFSYTVGDDAGATSNVATVSVVATLDGNIPPAAADDSAIVLSGLSALIDVLANDADLDGVIAPTTVSVTAAAAHGTTSVDPVTGAITYSHDGGAATTDSFAYVVQDAGGASSNSATVAITIATSSLPGAGLVLHLEADAGVVESAGRVTAWNDQSPSGNHLVGIGDPRRVLQELNGHPVLRFDGSDDRMERIGGLTGLPAGSADRSVFLVVDYRSNGNGGFSYGDRGCNKTFGVVVDANGQLMTQGWCGSSDFHSNTQGAGAGFLTQAVVLAANQWTHYRNGAVIDGGTHAFGTDLQKIVVGAEIDGAPRVDMDVAAILVYDRALTETERLQVEAALAVKYFASSGNQPPVTAADAASVDRGLAVVIDVLANDADVDGALDPATVTITTPPAHGAAVPDPSTGLVAYLHDGSPTASDSFAYTVDDEDGATSAATTVSLTVLSSVNLPPVAGNDSGFVATGGSVAIDVLANDGDVDGTLDRTAVVVVVPPEHGTIQVDPISGIVTYGHNGSAINADSFTYTVRDDDGATSNVATVNVTVSDVSIPTSGLVLHLEADAGVIESAGRVTAWNDQSPSGNHLGGVGDPQLVLGALNGRPVLRFDGVDDRLERIGGLAGLPAGASDRSVFVVVDYRSNGNGGFSFGDRGCNKTFGLVVDKNGQLMTQGWCGPNDFPSGSPGTGQGFMTQAVIVASNEWTHYSDGLVIGGGSHTFATDLQKIVVGAEIDGSPRIDMDVAAILVYDRALSATERLQVESALAEKYFAGAANQPPVVADDTAFVDLGLAVDIAILANDIDIDGQLDPATVAITTPPDHGTAVVDPLTGIVTYTHDGSLTAADSFAYTVADDEGATSAAATVSLTVTSSVNLPPIANDDAGSVAIGGSVLVDVLANDSDLDGALDTTSVVVIAAPDHGTTQVDPVSGAITYVHDGSATSADVFTYAVEDDDGELSNVATVTLSISEFAVPTAGLVLHLEADAGVVTSVGRVTAWNDQSPSGNDLTGIGEPQLVTGGLNGRPVLRFDGVDDRLERIGGLTGLPAGASDRSVFLVVEYRSSGIGGFSYGDRGCNKTFGVVVDKNGQLMTQGWCGANDFSSNAPGVGAGAMTQALVLASNQWTHYSNGAVIDGGSQAFGTDLQKIVVGAEIDGSPRIDMDVAAILVYDRALSASERLQVEAALGEKYLGL